ncbi:hypothetical protein [Vibrio alginolyticus]|uniref:hypothetical protein n=1 Tax=Vibrio alginolyticus TaxID=663 RepID=UPI001BD23409|nr:hypothetical protein [Vibrio alginolyticus]MBT0110865.1 hypothetical protein [Vibrio alginolyticus]
MNSEYEKTFTQGFVIDETCLRKLREIISNRVKADIVFGVKREDGFSYETENLEELLEKEHSSHVTIRSINIFSTERVQHAKTMSINLDFAKGDTGVYRFNKGVRLRIEGKNRDIVNLLGDDITTYLQNSIVIKSNKLLKYFSILIFLVFAGSLWSKIDFTTQGLAVLDPTTELYKSLTDSEKIDYLVKASIQRDKSTRGIIIPVLLLIFTLFVLMFYETGAISRLKEKFFPKYTFLFNLEAERYKSIQNLKKNVIWVVVVGFLISMISGVVVWYITTK